ncbi:MAG: succinate dehydrogenase, cytochrome b556 subunit [Burkholderiaceae bacterium]|nr:succinate dehydrogenase, cytochrome b556 subunit [Burkholderiaceae bacterium]
MTTSMQKTRPKFLQLHNIRLPLPGFVSILHRISGMGLFLCLPLLLWLLDNSLHSASSFSRFQVFIANPLVKIVLLGLIWAFLHHLCAGIRYIALDLHFGTELPKARASSWVVLAVSIALTVIAGVKLW